MLLLVIYTVPVGFCTNALHIFISSKNIDYFLGRPKFVRTKHEVGYLSAHLYLVGFKFDHQNVYNVITTCMFSSIMRRNLGQDSLTADTSQMP
jgi:hypothetical protein